MPSVGTPYNGLVTSLPYCKSGITSKTTGLQLSNDGS